jgi:hypothetical protein
MFVSELHARDLDAIPATESSNEVERGAWFSGLVVDDDTKWPTVLAGPERAEIEERRRDAPLGRHVKHVAIISCVWGFRWCLP